MKSFALPHYFALFWARMYAFGSLVFLIVAGFMVASGNPLWSSRTYMFLLMGFVAFYIISVQHGAIPFPRNFGGWHKRSATLSFIFMFAGLLIQVFYGRGLFLYQMGFLLYLLFQHRTLLVYRWRSRKWQFDELFSLFFASALFWGLLFSLPITPYFALIHSLFIGFQLNIFLACAYFMIPRFSRRVRERLTGGRTVGIIVWILLNGAIILNFTAFLLRVHFPLLGRWMVDVDVLGLSGVLLQVAAWFLIISLLLYLFNIIRFVKDGLKVASVSHIASILYFVIGAYFSTRVASGDYAFKPMHEEFMIVGMMLMAISMGYHWFMLNFSLPGSRYPLVYLAALVPLLLAPLWGGFISLFAFVFPLWFILEISRNRRMLLEDFRRNFREILSIF